MLTKANNLESSQYASHLMTETWGNLATVTEVLSAEDGGQIALTHVHPIDDVPRQKPVILIPGMFSNRHFWVSPKGIGLASALAHAGSHVWLVERRQLGRSPTLSAGIRAGMVEHIQHDLPLVQRHIQSITPGLAVWGGHSFGGVIAARALAETLDRQQVAGLLLFAAQIEVDKHALRWPHNLLVRFLARLCGRLPSRRLGLGPEDEPIAAVDDACRWRMNTQRGGDLLRPLERIACPILAFAGVADDQDPPAGCEQFLTHMSSTEKRYVLLGKNNGYSHDYDHPGIVVSKSAATEVWPMVVDWVAHLEKLET